MCKEMYNQRYYNLGNNIRCLRELFEETEEQLAFSIGVGATAISNYELGEREPERDRLISIAKHFGVTLDSLLNGDFSGLKKTKSWKEMRYNTIENRKNVMEKISPILVSEKALENSNFNKAYSLHMKFKEHFYNSGEFCEEILECMVLYEKAFNEKVIESAANYLGLVMLFFGFMDYVTPGFLESVDVLDKNDATVSDFIDACHLYNDDNNTEFSQEVKALIKAKREFITENSTELLLYIHQLVNSVEYNDIGYYYMALRYYLNMTDSDLGKEQSREIGKQMMLSFAYVGNKYAMQFEGLHTA